MSNHNKDALFSLIKSLNRSEKRQFKLYVNRLQINADAKFLLLFEALDKLEEYDEIKEERELLKEMSQLLSSVLHKKIQK